MILVVHVMFFNFLDSIHIILDDKKKINKNLKKMTNMLFLIY